ncbi:MAG TPA: methionine biosynthesis protein MetW [Solirubrobacteraceae bacterium]|nr:methionine biosynthesis protein MetW [Solirubrobacteraceae bacterium]
MLKASERQILSELERDALVLDVGGGAQPFRRADWVIDIMEYGHRGLYGDPPAPELERFGPATWVTRDICLREPWPFEDRQFDFAICSHTLEDVRDPIYVCDEMIRVARAGYVEVPSRLEEQSYGFQGPWTGWGHHRWLIDLDEDELTFVFKHHVVERDGDHFTPEFHAALSSEQRVHRLWWEGGFRYGERVFLEGAGLDAYLQDFVTAQAPGSTPPVGRRTRFKRPRGPSAQADPRQ